MILRGVGAGDLKKKKNTPLDAEFSPIVYLAFPSFHRAPYHWTTIIPSYGFPNRAEKKMGTTTCTRVLCTQYLLRVAIYYLSTTVKFRRFCSLSYTKSVFDMALQLSYTAYDEAPEFLSELMTALLEITETTMTTTLGHNARSNGVIEVFWRYWNRCMRMLPDDQYRQWPRFISRITFAYNTAPHQSIGASPRSRYVLAHLNGPNGIVAAAAYR